MSRAKLKAALAKANVINIDGVNYNVQAWLQERGELHFENETTGEQFVNTLDELEEDQDEIELYTLTKCFPS